MNIVIDFCRNFRVAVLLLSVFNHVLWSQDRDSKTEVRQKKPSLRLTSGQFQQLQTDLAIPPITTGEPAAGKRVAQQLRQFRRSEVHHVIYLPVNFRTDDDRLYPVIFEFAGNGPYKNRLGDRCSGKIEDCRMGFGLSGGQDFIWVCLPFVSADKMQNQLQWWGDADATADYCQQVVQLVVDRYKADPDRLLLCGFSRGAIACNYIGLRNDQIAKLWRGMICHSHYDGVRQWSYPDSDHKSALSRLKRLGNTPQLISHETSTKETRKYLTSTGIVGNFQFLDLPFPNHTDAWLLKPSPERNEARNWLAKVIAHQSK